MPRGARAIALVAAMLALAAAAGEQDPLLSFSIRRDIRESDGTTARIYSDGSALLTVVFNANNRVVDCMYVGEKAASQAVSWLFYEALIHQERGNNTAYFADVKRIYRRCKRQLREALDNVTAEEHREATTRKLLKDGFEADAPWCSFHDPEVPSRGHLTPEDTCCKALRNCSVHIGGFQRKYDLFNYYSEPAFGCSCAAEFAACLRAAASPLARRLLEAYVGSGAVRCVTLDDNGEQCEQYDDLYFRCLKTTRVVRASFASPLKAADATLQNQERRPVSASVAGDTNASDIVEATSLRTDDHATAGRGGSSALRDGEL